jgi:hypothetical protein
MSSKAELAALIQYIENTNVKTHGDIEHAIASYFTMDVVWSPLKDEWRNHMTSAQRAAFIKKAHALIVTSKQDNIPLMVK